MAIREIDSVDIATLSCLDTSMSDTLGSVRGATFFAMRRAKKSNRLLTTHLKARNFVNRDGLMVAKDWQLKVRLALDEHEEGE